MADASVPPAPPADAAPAAEAEPRRDEEHGDRRRDSRRGSRSRSRSRRRRRRSGSRSHSRHRHRRSRRGSRSRSRSRSGSRRRHRRSRRRRRSRSYSEDRSRSRSRSRSHHRRRRRRRRDKKSNFDVGPGAAGVGAAGPAAGAGMPAGAPGAPGAPGMGAGAPGMGAPWMGGAMGQRPPMQGGFGGNPMMMAGGMMPPMRPPMVSNQQTRHARRLYVGGCGDTTEDELMKFWTETVNRAVKVQLEGAPVLSVYVNRERRFAFVEFASIELANACMNLDGIMFKGNALRVRRPNDYRPDLVPPPMGPPLQLDMAAVPRGAAGGGNAAHNSKDRIFVGGIPYSMTEPQIRELLAAFGELKDLQLISENGQPKGFGFAEYKDPAVTDKAIESLNGIRIGDRELTVRRANPPGTATPPPPRPPPGRQTQAQAGGMMMGMQMGMPGMAPGMPMGMPGMPMGMPMGMGPGMGAPAGPPPTRVVVLANMVTEDDLKDETEYKEILEDVEEECRKFGEVSTVVMPKPGEPGCGKVFVEFKELAGAQQGFGALNNRKFGPHTVAAAFMPEDKFAARDLS